MINILEVCESDFANNLAKEETEEADAASSYEKTTQENKITKTTKEQDAKYKSQEATALDKEITELSGDRDTSNTELSAVLESQQMLSSGSCALLYVPFDTYSSLLKHMSCKTCC